MRQDDLDFKCYQHAEEDGDLMSEELQLLSQSYLEAIRLQIQTQCGKGETEGAAVITGIEPARITYESELAKLCYTEGFRKGVRIAVEIFKMADR